MEIKMCWYCLARFGWASFKDIYHPYRQLCSEDCAEQSGRIENDG